MVLEQLILMLILAVSLVQKLQNVVVVPFLEASHCMSQLRREFDFWLSVVSGASGDRAVEIGFALRWGSSMWGSLSHSRPLSKIYIYFIPSHVRIIKLFSLKLVTLRFFENVGSRQSDFSIYLSHFCSFEGANGILLLLFFRLFLLLCLLLTFVVLLFFLLYFGYLLPHDVQHVNTIEVCIVLPVPLVPHKSDVGDIFAYLPEGVLTKIEYLFL